MVVYSSAITHATFQLSLPLLHVVDVAPNSNDRVDQTGGGDCDRETESNAHRSDDGQIATVVRMGGSGRKQLSHNNL